MAHSAAREVTQAVSVAAAYFEDTLQASPDTILVAGTLGAETLAAMMDESGLQGLRVQEIVDAGMMQAGAVTSTVAQMPKGWLAGVRGALKN
jgi:type IV pilus assembly protein PilM